MLKKRRGSKIYSRTCLARFLAENRTYKTRVAWQDIEPYKTGWKPEDYSSAMPPDILQGETELACLNEFIKTLHSTGYLHNHARMYLASYVVHFRRVKWQAGASWFLEHLLDGDEASNNLSWQWIASTLVRNLTSLILRMCAVILESPLTQVQRATRNLILVMRS